MPKRIGNDILNVPLFNYMAMAGWKPEQMTAGISGIMSLAAASGEDLASTSDIVTDALTAFGLKAKDAGHFSDVLAKASASSNTNVGMLGESFKYVAPVAGAMKYSVTDYDVQVHDCNEPGHYFSHPNIFSVQLEGETEVELGEVKSKVDKLKQSHTVYLLSVTVLPITSATALAAIALVIPVNSTSTP